MMLFWSIAAAMALLALAFLLVPVLRPRAEAGFTASKPRPWLALALALVLPLAAFLIYQQQGSPLAILHAGMPQMQAGADHPTDNREINQIADQLAAKLEAKPDNAEGWILLAHTYVALKRPADALAALEKATARLPDNPDLLADYADVLAISNDSKLEGKPEALIDKALALNPLHAKALALKGTLEFDRQNYAAAIAAWEKMLTAPELDAELATTMRANIEEARRLLSAAPEAR